MRRNVTLGVLVCAASVTSTSIPAFADTVSGTSRITATSYNQSVWVAKDVTRKNDYTLTYGYFDKNHNPVKLQTVAAPLFSLVQFEQVPMHQAIKDHEDYVVPQANESQSVLDTQLESLHKNLFQQLNPRTSLSSNRVHQGPNNTSGSYVSGTMQAPSGDSWTYEIDYTNLSSSVDVSQYFIGADTSNEPSGVYLDHVAWDGNSRYFGESIVNAGGIIGFDPSPVWTGVSGHQFVTVLTYNGVSYSGYVTLN
ncbi:hypothetical protein JZ785_23995 [Alicyclobacillus curvatus]|nr:hypothetical protein JZ785_23995 [Alicyclobacillus curvatus]